MIPQLVMYSLCIAKVAASFTLIGSYRQSFCGCSSEVEDPQVQRTFSTAVHVHPHQHHLMHIPKPDNGITTMPRLSSLDPTPHNAQLHLFPLHLLILLLEVVLDKNRHARANQTRRAHHAAARIIPR